MLALGRLGRLGLAAGTAAVLATGLATNAQAATGTLRYFSITGEEFRASNPPDNVCIKLRIRPDLIDNHTNKTVSVYLNADCSLLVVDLEPGRAAAHLGGPRSVRFIG
ncbi:hypothetical protein AB0D14_37335 [Streptomyces sp. NPDC048484]|uniref:hypothetical protein n=1 Tax=Streptomyces sp. NPDC048484 TaxID=3155146 RepID=UPI0034176BBF